jgi:hypothetical protein
LWTFLVTDHHQSNVMNDTRVVGGGNASREDHEAAAVLEQNEINRLPLVRTRAEKWLGGLTALTGLFGTALIIKGPQSTADISTPWRVAVALLIVLAFTLLLFGTYRAYQSAYGDPGRLDQMRAQPLTGLAERLTAARRRAAAAAQAHVRDAVTATLVAVVLLATAIGITWFAPAGAKTNQKSVCLVVGGEKIAELVGDSVTVRTLSSGTELRHCS